MRYAAYKQRVQRAAGKQRAQLGKSFPDPFTRYRYDAIPAGISMHRSLARNIERKYEILADPSPVTIQHCWSAAEQSWVTWLKPIPYKILDVIIPQINVKFHHTLIYYVYSRTPGWAGSRRIKELIHSLYTTTGPVNLCKSSLTLQYWIKRLRLTFSIKTPFLLICIPTKGNYTVHCVTHRLLTY